MAPIDNAVYATLLMNDGYLPGAIVLGHSLRDKGAKGKLVVLVVVEKVSSTTIEDLKTVYDEVVPVAHIMNNAPANLYLMNRPDLIGAFTKIQLWKQTQYKRIVYIDADVVALRAPNELLTMDTEFAAVPDIGWPDCFNSGVMVLNPNLADYYALLALAERGISFDGADQGLLNMHFTEWEKLSFKYNCTPSGNYQYVPAYRHFQSTINLVHFIGRDKPWTLGRRTGHNTGVYGELLGRWWAVYDKHYRAREIIYYETLQYQLAPKKVQDYVTGEETLYMPAYQAPPAISVQPPPESGSSGASEQPMGDQPSVEEQIRNQDFEPTPTVQQRRWSAPHTDWEPSRAPPPANSKPEAANFPTQIYDFSEDVKLFRPPDSYPEAPKDMWYEVPAKPVSQPKLKPIFPWEGRAPKPTRVFAAPKVPSPPVESFSPRSSISSSSFLPSSFMGQFAPRQSLTGISAPPGSSRSPDKQAPSQNQEFGDAGPSSSASTAKPDLTFHPDGETASRSSSVTDQTDTVRTPVEEPKYVYVNPWEALKDRTNVWDDMPEIAQYVQALQPPRRAPIQVLHHTPSVGTEDLTSPIGQSGRRRSLRVTDFPTETERPSLPVTPAPIRRPTFWGDETEMSGELPMAEGVPKQDEWVRRFSSYPTPAFASIIHFAHEHNGILSFECQHCGKQNPFAKLDELQRRQSELLLANDNVNLLKEPPRRDLPESGSQEAVQAAVDKAHSSSSARPLKPILKEPKFELSDAPVSEISGSPATSVHNAVTEEADALSPSDAGENNTFRPIRTSEVIA